MNKLTLSALALLFTLGLAGCSDNEPDEGVDMEQAADNAGDMAEEAGENMEDAAEETGEAVEEGAEETGEAIEEAGEEDDSTY